MHYSKIHTYDIANGPGVRVSLFVSGCRHHCKGCFNSDTWDFEHGQLFTEETVIDILDALNEDWIAGFSLLGGEPFEPENQLVLVGLLRRIREQHPDMSIWCWTGFLYDVDLVVGGNAYTSVTDEMLSYIDILVDGPFVEAEKDLKLEFRGSRNQRVIDLKGEKSYGKGVKM